MTDQQQGGDKRGHRGLASSRLFGCGACMGIFADERERDKHWWDAHSQNARQEMTMAGWQERALDRAITVARLIAQGEMEMATGHFDSGWWSGLLAIMHYTDPQGEHPHPLAGGLAAIDSPQSKTTNLGNPNLHDGTWLRTHTITGDRYLIFLPKPDLIQERKPNTSILWHTFVVQHANGFRYSLVPDSVMGELTHGVKGD